MMLLVMFMLLVFVFLAWSGMNVWLAWLMMELMNFVFIPYSVLGLNFSVSGSFVYLIVQSVSSCLFLVSGMMMNINLFYYYLFMMSMILKLGVFPFYYWLLKIVENFSWGSLNMIMTVMKGIPMSLLSVMYSSYMLIGVSLSSLLMSISGVIQVSLRKIMIFSSLGHSSWIIMSTLFSKLITLIYFLLYWPLVYLFCLFSFSFNLNYLSSLMLWKMKNLFVVVFMLSMVGLPPLLGFFPKLMVLGCMLKSYFLEGMLMLGMSVFPMYFYMKMMIFVFFSFDSKLSFMYNMYEGSDMFFYLLLLLNLLMLLMMIILL